MLEEGLDVKSVTWMQYTTYALLPSVVMLLVVPLLTRVMEKPQLNRIDNKKIAREGLAALGPMKLKEKILAFLFIAAILAWSAGSCIGINANAVAVLFVGLLLCSGVLKWSDLLANKAAWSTFMWYGGVIGVIATLTKTGFFDWLGGFIQNWVNLSDLPWVAVMAILVLIVIVCRYLFASGVVFVGTVLPILVAIACAADVPPIPALMLLALASVYGGQVTHYSGTLSPILFGVGYVSQQRWWAMSLVIVLACALISFVVGIPYWKLLGLL